ncbi:MAG: S-adenosylmethionine:tRNA ribosyltransferase-isomerase [Ignavibacteria bacterium]|nr:S-adenosylmethionine:tRNA ribosyltransferase-isomerase [Ignavibacteria bacterium]
MPNNVPTVLLTSFEYQLPSDRIALHPLPIRDQSKLLVYHCEQNSIQHRSFSEIAEFLPSNSMLVTNSTKVVAARIAMQKSTGGFVEVLLTQPADASVHPEALFASAATSDWRCLIGGKNVSEGMTLTTANSELSATVIHKNGPEATVTLNWETGKPLSEVIKQEGSVPLPPYIKRSVVAEDVERYQTVYANSEGSVAAPTAGLHFTNEVFEKIRARKIETAEVVLHVGLGTFKTIDVADIQDHEMHSEQIDVSRVELEKICRHLDGPTPYITAVGTTSVRTLESVHWFGANLIVRGANPGEVYGANPGGEVHIAQWSAFDPELQHVKVAESFRAVLEYVRAHNLDSLWGTTQLILAPGAKIAVVNALITNFHHPGNTLLLLVAAFVGGDDWRTIYREALNNEYRFLSYGDSSLLIR